MISRKQYARLIVTFALLGTAASVRLQGTEGVNLIGLGPVQKSLAGAGVADPKGSCSVLSNPAGLTGLDRQLSLSTHLFMPSRTLDSNVNPAPESSDDTVFFIPTFSAKLGEWAGIHWGFGVFGSSGMGTDYEDSRIHYYGGDSRAEYGVAKLVLAGAVDLGNGWSVGAGPVIVLSRMRTDMLDATMTPGSDEWDYAWGLGYSLGILKRWERWSIGASFLSEQYQEKWDKYRSLMSQRLSLPEQVQVGVAYQVTDAVEVMFDYRFVHWSGVPQWGDEPDEGGFGWDDQHCFKLGVEWKVDPKLTLRTGVSYGKSPIDSSAVFANGLFPAITETHAAIGFTYHVSERIDLHGTYTHAFHNAITDDGSQMGGWGTGTRISMHQNAVSAGMTWHF
jgi:long-chain fatty acid transport protein